MDTESLKSGFSEVSNRSRRTPVPPGGLPPGGMSTPNSLILGHTNGGLHLSTLSGCNGGNNGTLKGYPHNNLGTPVLNNSMNSVMANGYGGLGLVGQNGYGNTTPNGGGRHHARTTGNHSSHRSHRSGRSSRNREEPLLETPESGHGSEIEAMDQMSPSTHIPQDSSRSGLRGEGHEAIEVQILPQDDGWADTATAVTGNTSDRSNSPVGNNGTANSIKWAQMAPPEDPSVKLSWCQRYSGSLLGAGIVVIAAASPVLMVVGHRVGLPSNRPIINVRECGPECHAFLISLSVKLIVLFGAIWAIFWRSSPATMPRIFFFRAITLLLAFLAAFTFWLFYWVRAEGDGDLSMVAAVTFASGLADALLAIHYLGVLLTEVRHVTPQFQITAVRSPDGISRQWTIGSLSIQRAAVWVLQHYYAEFPAYNPHLDRLPSLRKRHASISNSNAPSFKFYDFDGTPSSFSQACQKIHMILHSKCFFPDSIVREPLKGQDSQLMDE